MSVGGSQEIEYSQFNIQWALRRAILMSGKPFELKNWRHLKSTQAEVGLFSKLALSGLTGQRPLKKNKSQLIENLAKQYYDTAGCCTLEDVHDFSELVLPSLIVYIIYSLFTYAVTLSKYAKGRSALEILQFHF